MARAAKTEAGTPYKPQCRALTADGQQCRNSARGASKYCASHKGYQPPAAKGLAKRIEGDSWSATDKRTDRQSVGDADIEPVVAKAKDTALAVRKKGGKASKAAPKPGKAVTAVKSAKAAKAAPTGTRRAASKSAKAKTSAAAASPTRAPLRSMAPDRGSDPGYVASILQGERDYLVVYEEPDPDGMAMEDGVVLDIDAGSPVSLGEVNLEQKLDLELNNNTTWVGRLGFILAVVGAAFATATCIWFWVVYPEQWYVANGEVSGDWKVPATALFAVSSFLLMLAGVILTHYGRRIQARGNLSRMRIVEKAFQPRVALGEDR